MVANHKDTQHVSFPASFRRCMVVIGDASYFLQSTLVKDKIVAYISFLERIIAMK